MAYTREELKILNKSAIAKQLNMSSAYVDYVLTGERPANTERAKQLIKIVEPMLGSFNKEPQEPQETKEPKEIA
ncbi:hypothetical protein [Croceivirga sp. JEA036]|uniref:hypothetical protein n=1 Tax=Croceivirga sp. JEA036 TaxID=2721162 RepID=UPI001439E7B2|nr:hypothetical protein [Croceivirga sp. JEA036]NJB36355.1 hypothetical protein [Croceivirga sp. JEA036]